MTERTLVVQHAATGGPGWLGEWLPTFGLELDQRFAAIVTAGAQGTQGMLEPGRR